MATMTEIEAAAGLYSMQRAVLAARVAALQADIAEAKRKHIDDIREAVAKARDIQAQLREALEASPELFTKPKSRTFHGVKLGYRKGTGSIAWDDEAKVIARIRALLPNDQAELLIRVKESVHKPGVYDLSAADLKRLGIQVKDAGDVLFITDTTDEVDALVDALLAESTQEVAS